MKIELSKVTTTTKRPQRRFRSFERYIESLELRPVVKCGRLHRGDFLALAIDGNGRLFRVTDDKATPITPAESVALYIDAEAYDNRRIAADVWPQGDYTVWVFGGGGLGRKGEDCNRDCWLRSLAGGSR